MSDRFRRNGRPAGARRLRFDGDGRGGGIRAIEPEVSPRPEIKLAPGVSIPRRPTGDPAPKLVAAPVRIGDVTLVAVPVPDGPVLLLTADTARELAAQMISAAGTCDEQ